MESSSVVILNKIGQEMDIEMIQNHYYIYFWYLVLIRIEKACHLLESHHVIINSLIMLIIQ